MVYKMRDLDVVVVVVVVVVVAVVRINSGGEPSAEVSRGGENFGPRIPGTGISRAAVYVPRIRGPRFSLRRFPGSR